jgi:hypothetical protein
MRQYVEALREQGERFAEQGRVISADMKISATALARAEQARIERQGAMKRVEDGDPKKPLS